jgi:hypothetical protein
MADCTWVDLFGSRLVVQLQALGLELHALAFEVPIEVPIGALKAFLILRGSGCEKSMGLRQGMGLK